MNKYNQRSGHKQQQNYTRINFQIRAVTVRVVRDGEQLGVFPIDKAREMARSLELDLVEIVPSANPPVCSIMNYDKYRYQQKQKEKEQKRNQKTVETKELRLRPCIQDHDIEIKVKAIKKFLSEGKRVQLNLKYKNREMHHKEEGFRVINKIIAELSEVANIERQPKMEGTQLICRLEPKQTGA